MIGENRKKETLAMGSVNARLQGQRMKPAGFQKVASFIQNAKPKTNNKGVPSSQNMMIQQALQSVRGPAQ